MIKIQRKSDITKKLMDKEGIVLVYSSSVPGLENFTYLKMQNNVYKLISVGHRPRMQIFTTLYDAKKAITVNHF